MIRIDGNSKVYLGNSEIATIKKGDTVIWQKSAPAEIDYFYIENTYPGNNTISFYSNSSGTVSPDLYTTTFEVSKNKTDWTNATRGNSFTLGNGEKLYIRNNNGKWNYYGYSGGYVYNCTVIRGTQNHSCGGNIKSLIDYENLNTVTVPQGSFGRMFYQDSFLTKTPDISNVECSIGWTFFYSFYQCNRLTTITSFPNDSVYGERCFQYAFQGCVGLMNTPSIIPAERTTRSTFAYTFHGCSKLKKAPVLKTKTLTQECYSNLFYNCYVLNEITTYADNISATSCLKNWLNNVSATGDFYNLGSATYPSGTNGIPSGWTEHKLKMTDVVLTPATGTEYSVTANLEWSSTLTWTSAEINISNTDQGAGDKNTYLTFTPSEVVKGVLTTANNIDVWFSNPNTWFTLTVYNNGTVVDTQYITYTTQ